jgi:predicted transposase YbfD/YdcC
MSVKPSLSLLNHFAKLADPRVQRTRLHRLFDMIALTICGVICGCKNWVEIETYGNKKLNWLKAFLELPNGIPSHDTLGRVFARIKPEAFQACFRSWIQALAKTLGIKQIAIDGKTLRRSHQRGAGQSALHLVSAWATANHLTLGQVATDAKSNEITAIPRLLETLDLSGAIVTIDAMGCQKDIASHIRHGDGHYLLAVKENQQRLFTDIQESFTLALEEEGEQAIYSYHQTVDRGHGRLETRQYFTIQDPVGIRDRELWKDLRTINMVISERQVKGEASSTEVRYYIGSKLCQAKHTSGYIRGHWGIENSLHWVLDMAFDEDHNRTRKDHSQENLGLLRRLAVSLIKNNKTCKGSIRNKQMQAMLDDEVLASMFSVF